MVANDGKGGCRSEVFVSCEVSVPVHDQRRKGDTPLRPRSRGHMAQPLGPCVAGLNSLMAC